MNQNLTGIILAGGKSSRIGTDKAHLKLNSITIIEHIVNTLSQILNDIVIITNNPPDYSILKLELHEDIHPGFGPLSGIHAGLFYSMSDKNIFVTCDMPFVSKKILLELIDEAEDSSITLFKHQDKVQPFPGIYTKKCLAVSERILLNAASNNFYSKKVKGVSMADLIKAADAKIIEADKLAFTAEYDFFNVNSPDDFNKAKGIYSKLITT